MQCPEEIIARLFYNNVSSSFQLVSFLFICIFSMLFAKIFTFLGGKIFSQYLIRNHQDEYDQFGTVYSNEDEEVEEGEEEEDEYYHAETSVLQDDHLVADIIHQGGETLMFLPPNVNTSTKIHHAEDAAGEQLQRRSDSETNDSDFMSTITMDQTQNGSLVNDNDNYDTKRAAGGKCDHDNQILYKEEEEAYNIYYKLRRDDQNNYFVCAPAPSSKLESKKIQPQHHNKDDEEEIFWDSNGSTSKSSSQEWRIISSINVSGADDQDDDPFSSSSRRSCPNWESYSTVFQNYDEEMLFLDGVSAQKLSETESLRTIQACPRSVSERIVHKIWSAAATSSRKNKIRCSEIGGQNPYHELESAYVAQICLTWEALSWNYNYFFQRRRLIRNNILDDDDDDPGCPADVAQQFQQFQLLLQRYIENEPYECGRRPEIYARMRSLAPKLLQVPEYREEELGRSCNSSRNISSDSFLMIMEEAIRTFMNFLKDDKENHCQILLADFFRMIRKRRRRRRGSADPTLLLLLKKINKRKKMKLKDHLGRRGSRKCLMMKRKSLKERGEEEMEILMAHIDLKVVCRVLRMSELNDEELHWCQDKMSKVRISHDGKLVRDSSPLFFPAAH